MTYSISNLLLVSLALVVLGCAEGVESRDESAAPSPADKVAATGSPSGSSGTATQEADDEGAGASASAPRSAKDDPAISAIRDFIAEQEENDRIDRSKSDWKTSLPKPQEVDFDSETDYFWNLETNKGDIKIRLMPDVAPMHVSSTLYLTELGFYDGLLFHRVIPDFMAQGGDPLGNGRGSPGYRYGGEFDPTVRHDRPGLLSMANAGSNTDGSQFFLTFRPTPHLDGKHTIFGEVVEGMDTLKAIEAEGTAPLGKTKSKVQIEKASISLD